MRLPLVIVTYFFLLSWPLQGAEFGFSVPEALEVLKKAPANPYKEGSKEFIELQLAAKRVSDFCEERASAAYDGMGKKKSSRSKPSRKDDEKWQLLREKIVALLKESKMSEPSVAGRIFRSLRSSTVEGVDKVCDSFALRAVLYDYYRRDEDSGAADWWNANLTEKEKDGIDQCFDDMGYDDEEYFESEEDDKEADKEGGEGKHLSGSLTEAEKERIDKRFTAMGYNEDDFFSGSEEGGMRGSQSKQLEQPSAKAHEEVKPARIHAGRYACEQCASVYTRADTLKKHFDSAHLHIRYLCPEPGCNKDFKTTVIRDAHIKGCHNMGFVCKVEGCGEVFKSKANLSKHKNEKHGGHKDFGDEEIKDVVGSTNDFEFLVDGSSGDPELESLEKAFGNSQE